MQTNPRLLILWEVFLSVLNDFISEEKIDHLKTSLLKTIFLSF